MAQRPWKGNGIAEVRGPQAKNGPNGEGGTQLPPNPTVSSIARHHPNGLLTSPGAPHIKSLSVRYCSLYTIS
ncbi:hypothetical protein KIN20_028867 [Parelaphostrongylus tenuis]|uniref:Uncharacterized protein n=1 Tax=Parelaphostrongylus tenuis TaxID=148309 RepID=A0AAD5R267_PARTN|nr:hypothetical protein KIN20_028867 [Parelaphostrongylus tenuis]